MIISLDLCRPTEQDQARKRRKIRRLIPDDLYWEGSQNHETVELSQVRREYAVVTAGLELATLSDYTFTGYEVTEGNLLSPATQQAIH